jgi:hypothetical protein
LRVSLLCKTDYTQIPVTGIAEYKIDIAGLPYNDTAHRSLCAIDRERLR